VIGFGVAVWASLHVFERAAGADIWAFSAPYPYRWMREDPVHDLPPREFDAAEHDTGELPRAA